MHRPLKILYTIPNFDTAGSGKVLYDLAKNLDKSQFEVHIACNHTKGLFFEVIETLGLPIHVIKSTVNIRPYSSLLFRIKPFMNFIKEHQFDLVHSWHWSSDWTEVIAARLGGAKFIYTKKAMSWGNTHWKIRSFLSNYIITVNGKMKGFFNYKRNQRLIPFGIDLEYYDSTKFKKNSTNIEYFKIITVANLVPVKSIESLLKAIKSLKTDTVQLAIIGDDSTSYSKDLKLMVHELCLSDTVFFYGKKQDVRQFLVDSDLYIICSKQEGMPMALVEAMAMGLPVLGSNVPGIQDVLKDFSELLFDFNDIDGLSHKIAMIKKMTIEDRIKLGAELRSYCERNFSLNEFIEAHENLYLKLNGRVK